MDVPGVWTNASQVEGPRPPPCPPPDTPTSPSRTRTPPGTTPGSARPASRRRARVALLRHGTRPQARAEAAVCASGPSSSLSSLSRSWPLCSICGQTEHASWTAARVACAGEGGWVSSTDRTRAASHWLLVESLQIKTLGHFLSSGTPS
jgi:hypothetical protein